MRNKLILLASVAFIVRVGLGAFGFTYLPTLQSKSEPQKAGYLFYDAYHRDIQAWEIANSDAPLSIAFSEKHSSDQYGGLLWTLSALYRTIPISTHAPILPVILGALAASIGVVFFTLACAQFLPQQTAILLGWAMALYPESVLLGASQMREPYLIMLVSLGLYAMVALGNKRVQTGGALMVIAIVGSLLISPGIALPMILLFVGWLLFGAWKHKLPVGKLLMISGILIAAFVLAIVVIGSSWESVTAYKGGGVLGIITEWAKRTAQYNTYLLKQSSGIVQVMLEALPAWLAFPFVAIYGLLQPVLPAVIFEPGESFWKIVGFFRAIGWYTLLPILMVLPLGMLQAPKTTRKSQWYWIYLVVVIWIFISSLRGGGDQWDNPRYRTILLPAMLLLVGVYLQQLDANSRLWLKRIFAVEVFNLLIFCHWYAWRYTGIGFDLGIRNTILLGIVGSLILLLAIRKPKSTAL